MSIKIPLNKGRIIFGRLYTVYNKLNDISAYSKDIFSVRCFMN